MDSIIYRERVLPSKGTFALAPFLAVFLYGVWLPINEVVGVVSGFVGAVALFGILWLKAPVIEASERELRVGRARISRSLLGEVSVILPRDAFAERGQRLDARAFTSFQASVSGMVKVEVTDPNDPTPYWLFSSRNPEDLKAALS